ncbi:MAG: dihydrofolate reductase [Gammaproteobacteria bacterium]|nr:dihydrofolate reductase [Gammaproteobacteria bacterium]
MRIAMIVAMGDNRGIGKDGGMPWHLPADLKHFRELTMGKPIIMGRRTYESIGKPLEGRENIIVTRDPNFSVDGATVVNSFKDGLDAALKAADGVDEVMVIGGATLYTAFLPHAKKLYITEIKQSFDADTHFPPLNFGWEETSRVSHEADDKNPYGYDFVELSKT